jgi:hypothetical protein
MFANSKHEGASIALDLRKWLNVSRGATCLAPKQNSSTHLFGLTKIEILYAG